MQGKPNSHPVPATPRPIPGATSPSEALFHEPRGAQEHKGRQEPELRTQRNEHPVGAPPRAAPAGPHAQCAGVKSIMRSHWEQLSRSPFGLRGLSAYGWDMLWGAGEKQVGIAQHLLWDI